MKECDGDGVKINESKNTRARMTEQPTEHVKLVRVDTEKIRLQERILNENTTKTCEEVPVILNGK